MGPPQCAHLCVALGLGGNEVVEDLGNLSEVDVDELCLEVQAEEGEEVSFFYLNQLIVPLGGRE